MDERRTPEEPRKRVTVLVNAKSGTTSRFETRRYAESLAAAFERADLDAEVRVVPGAHLYDAARAAVRAGVDAVVACGGDGTISAVASALAGGKVALGVVAGGTRNHFARDLKIPSDLDEAARIVAAGATRSFDVGEVNSRTFVNNSSIGLYPRIVYRRELRRLRLGDSKLVAMIVAGFSVFRRFPVVRVEIQVDGRTLERTTPFVFVGNNEYTFNFFAFGTRARLDEGRLSVYVPNRTGRFGLVRLMLRGLFGRLDQARDFDLMSATRFRVVTRKRGVRVSIDGEVVRMRSPLEYRARPGALRVLVPE